MPELPEVETTLRGIEPYLRNAIITNIEVRNPNLRWPVPTKKLAGLIGHEVSGTERRAKYILVHTLQGTILLHLGMSGSLSVLDKNHSVAKHDHIDIEVNASKIIRLNDPRRFGCCLLVKPPVFSHKLLANLGPEPLGADFDGDYLFQQSRSRAVCLKTFIMDGKVVVGVGNIYASEALYRAGLRPTSIAKRVSRVKYRNLAIAIKDILKGAIRAGGTTLNDFTQADGKPGYFKQELQVYGRSGEVCHGCDSIIKSKIIGQRNTFYCPSCQKG